MKQAPAVICDNGSGFLKIGFEGDIFPRHTLPGIIGRPLLRASQKLGDVELKPIMISDEAAPHRSMLELSYPLVEGKVKDWDDMEILWDYAFRNKLGLGKDLSDRKIMLTEAALNPKKVRERFGEIMFEKFGFGKMFVEVQAILSLICEGLHSGMVLDSGDGVTHCIPVYNFYLLDKQIARLDVAGRHVTQYLIRLLMLRGYAFNSSADYETVREIKEKLCFVSYDQERDDKLARETTVIEKDYKLPDGSVIRVGRERFEAPEVLFSPHKLENEQSGCADLVFETINKCPMDTRKTLYGNILLTGKQSLFVMDVIGGSTMYPGYPSRLEKDIKLRFKREKAKGGDITKSNVKIDVIDPHRRKHAVFIGASFYAGMNELNWVSKSDWQEKGPSCLHRQE